MSGVYVCLAAIGLLTFADTSRAQLQDKGADDSVRVTVAQNQDGSRTSYQYDNANHKAVATTTSADGKTLSKINYDLDELGRFKAGEVFDGAGKLRFKTQYKYDANGRLEQETQLTKDDTVQHKLVYSYSDAGKQTGYTVYNAAGKVIGQTTPSVRSAPRKRK